MLPRAAYRPPWRISFVNQYCPHQERPFIGSFMVRMLYTSRTSSTTRRTAGEFLPAGRSPIWAEGAPS